jgi:pilus assembly protein CpaD
MSPKTCIAVAAASLVLAAGCAQSQKNIALASGAHRMPTAQEVTAELRIAGAGGVEGLSELEREAVRVFASGYQSEGHGAVVISRPGGAQEDAGLRLAGEARAVLLAEGVTPALISEAPYGSGAGSPLVLSYRTWEAVAPNCPDVSHYDMTRTGNNGSLPSFGCATGVNLAAMIANPADLVRAAPMTPGDAGRSTAVMTKYRNGESTASARSADGSVSSAVGN